MNILLLNHYAGTPALGMEYRPYYLAREWVRLGHTVHIVAANYSHVRAKQPQRPPGLRLGEAAREVVDGIHYHWFPAPSYLGNGAGRVRNIASFLLRVRRAASALVQEIKPNVVIASSTYPMDIWVARHLARRAKAKLVYEVHDLWPLSPIELAGMSPKHPFIRVCQWAEDAAYRHSDVVVSMLPKVHSHMASRGMDLKRLVIVPNGIALDEWQGSAANGVGDGASVSPGALPERKSKPEPEPEALTLPAALAACLAGARAAKRTVVVYAGSMGAPNALDVLIDAAAQLQQAPFTFVLVGGGHERQALAARASALGLQHLHLFEPIPKAQVPQLLSQADVAYIGWQRQSLYRFGIAPNKLMDYMMAGRAVLHSVDAGNDPVAEAGCGLTVAPQNPAAVAAGLQQLAALSPAARQAKGERGRAFVLAHHTYSVLAQRFLDALQ